MLKSKYKNILKERNRRKQFLKIELKKIILKSIINNKNTPPLNRAYCALKLGKFEKLSSLSKIKNICHIGGRYKGVNNKIKMARHYIKKFNTYGDIQNLKIKSW